MKRSESFVFGCFFFFFFNTQSFLFIRAAKLKHVWASLCRPHGACSKVEKIGIQTMCLEFIQQYVLKCSSKNISQQIAYTSVTWRNPRNYQTLRLIYFKIILSQKCVSMWTKICLEKFLFLLFYIYKVWYKISKCVATEQAWPEWLKLTR